ncbi:MULTISPECIES: RluA family pseudouridine synthase [unclassified Polaribacter]|uniref:RluA family pseudouridine synthase n=1 Tax=unclassified Polaribacter TaxID=196858 RepID=UPI0011BDFFAF|nr:MULTISPECIES: pseudouridine synthase [unclassified Polaribacter]TXD53948.1 RluA family pseudouridine synthase [Polaribacter sp. IC063]TXD59657.1 RluA family pseudouridine synthase [Polaribacter sp. IC066]
MKHFQHFKKDISGISLPEKFTFPFYYQPHLLAKIATEELQAYLENQTDFEHNFGLTAADKELAIGKMFGVLVVKNKHNKLGYIAAFSGKLADKSLPIKFVPPIFNMRTEGSFYIKGEKEIEKLGEEIETLKSDTIYLSLKISVKKIKQNIEENLAFQRKKMKTAKQQRKIRKRNAEAELNQKEFEIFKTSLIQESFNQQFFYKELVAYYEHKIEKSNQQFLNFENRISELKKRRKEISANLQNTLFGKYQFLNQQKEQRGLLAIFDNPEIKPPAGAGDCSAPKLLQYAFQNDLTPICMAEFWWGISPNSEIRKHQNFYPACQGRCKPILHHMLAGIDMDENLLLENLGEKQELKIVYEDDAIIIVNKPPEFLSVPGKEIKDSVYTRMKKEYPLATGPIIVHRLDMSTSGILVLTKTKEANKIVQSQFINRTVKKRYIALLDGNLSEEIGIINLPLRLDVDDRPRQLVDFTHGKNAKTQWKVIERKNNQTRVHFFPITGRTHQLRIHAAHKDGLNAPIVGDDLYGKKQNRLHLHAEFIELLHPTTNKVISFTVDADF